MRDIASALLATADFIFMPTSPDTESAPRLRGPQTCHSMKRKAQVLDDGAPSHAYRPLGHPRRALSLPGAIVHGHQALIQQICVMYGSRDVTVDCKSISSLLNAHFERKEPCLEISSNSALEKTNAMSKDARSISVTDRQKTPREPRAKLPSKTSQVRLGGPRDPFKRFYVYPGEPFSLVEPLAELQDRNASAKALLVSGIIFNAYDSSIGNGLQIDAFKNIYRFTRLVSDEEPIHRVRYFFGALWARDLAESLNPGGSQRVGPKMKAQLLRYIHSDCGDDAWPHDEDFYSHFEDLSLIGEKLRQFWDRLGPASLFFLQKHLSNGL